MQRKQEAKPGWGDIDEGKTSKLQKAKKTAKAQKQMASTPMKGNPKKGTHGLQTLSKYGDADDVSEH